MSRLRYAPLLHAPLRVGRHDIITTWGAGIGLGIRGRDESGKERENQLFLSILRKSFFLRAKPFDILCALCYNSILYHYVKCVSMRSRGKAFPYLYREPLAVTPLL